MATVVLSLPQIQEDASAMARKRRREIILSQRTTSVQTSSLIPDETTSGLPSEPDAKKARKDASTVAACSKKKKPQMKYDPDIPMTKEEAAVWRREQRRKRNRESAAASRQRQRDRITELEIELDDWKVKYDEIMTKLHAMEEITQMKVTDDLIDSLPTVSPVSPITALIVSSTPSSLTITGKDDTEATVVSDSESEKEHDHNSISRPAVSRIITT
jgi:hypothetical protein